MSDKIRSFFLAFSLLFFGVVLCIKKQVLVLDDLRFIITVVILCIAAYLFELTINLLFGNNTFLSYTLPNFIFILFILILYKFKRSWLMICNIREELVSDTLLQYFKNKQIDCKSFGNSINVSEYNIEFNITYYKFFRVAILGTKNHKDLYKLNDMKQDLIIAFKGMRSEFFPMFGLLCLIVSISLIAMSIIRMCLELQIRF